MNTHIITKDTQFPIIQNGQNINISANELLNNIVAVLNASNYRESTEAINELKTLLSKYDSIIKDLQDQQKVLISNYAVLLDKYCKLTQ